MNSIQLRPEDQFESVFDSYRFKVILPDGRNTVIMVPGVKDGQWPAAMYDYDYQEGDEPIGLNLVCDGHYT